MILRPDHYTGDDHASEPGLSTLAVPPGVARLRQRGDLSARVLRSLGECAYEWDIGTDTLFWTEGSKAVLGLNTNADLTTGAAWRKQLLCTAAENREGCILSSAEEDKGDGVAYACEYALAGEHALLGEDIWLQDTGRWYADSAGTPIRAQGVVRLLNGEKPALRDVANLAKYDPLTGLYSRGYLNIALENVLKGLPKGGEPAAFMLVAIEHFELINSVYGYEAGDAVIVEMANRLKANLRDIDVIGRFSGARLGIILDNCDERSLLIAGHRIINLFRDNVIDTDSGPIAISLAIGGVLIPSHANSVRDTFHRAHVALAESFRDKDSTVALFRIDAERDAKRHQAMLMAAEIVSALREDRVHLAFQPVVRADGYEIDFHEALIRLETSDGETMQAGDFVATAQSLGLIRLVDHRALDLALIALNENPDALLSLNVSNDTASDPEWISKLAMAAMANDSLSRRLIIEITESHAVENLEECARFVVALHDLGFKVALDDFGAGFTSFRNLKELDFDIIKIDGHFARNLDVNAENRSFIKSLVELASLFNARTVVEWVEDDSTAQDLQSWGVDLLQGYKFGKPSRTALQQ